MLVLPVGNDFVTENDLSAEARLSLRTFHLCGALFDYQNRDLFG